MRCLLTASLIVYVVVAQNGSTATVLETDVERSILVSLYKYTNGDSWTKNDHWNNPEVHYCDWYGVQCINPDSLSRRRRLQSVDTVIDSSRSVQSIDLSENNLQGSVPISLLLLLPNIQSIRLNGNNLDFSQVEQQETEVLGQVLDLPISVHSSIAHLDISQTTVNDLKRIFHTGSGSTQILTPRLSNFYASQCDIRGLFPSFLMSVTTMERLALDHNALSGTLPVTLGNLRSLKYLSLSSNQLTGKIPETVDGLVKLRYLLLDFNRFTGTIPVGLTSIEYTPLLEQLDLSDQRDEKSPLGLGGGLTGTLPAFNSQKRLRRIDLGVNSFAGRIPATLLSATDLTDFDFIILGSNALSGTVPSSVVNRIPSGGLFLENNQITGLTGCPFSEYGCSAILCPPGSYEPRSGRQEEDRRPCLSCPQNTLFWGQTACRLEEGGPTSGPTPEPTRAPGSAPTTDQPTRLPTYFPTVEPPLIPVNEKQILLDLYTSTGGDDWFNKDGWSTPDDGTSFCDWHGVVCDGDTKSVKFLNLDNNNLLGTIDESIYTLPNLKALDLSQNGALEITFQTIGNARSLESLDLSKTIIRTVDGILDAAPNLLELHVNNVGGFEGQSFPSEFYQLTKLRQLSMDYNKASGRLPSDLGSLSRMVIFSAVDNILTGTIPSSITQMTDLATLRLASNHISGTIPTGIEEMRSLSLLDLSNQWSNGVDDDFSDGGKPGLHGPLPSFANLSQLRRLDLGVNSFSGRIPQDFLASVDTENLFEFADIGENFLTGSVPSTVSTLPNIYMQDNLLTGIDPLVCAGVANELKSFGCDAVLCAPGTFNDLGRQAAEDKPCAPCNSTEAATYFGSTACNVPFQAPVQQPAGEIISDTPQRIALELLYNGCGGTNWTSKTNWMDKTVPVCQWEGIVCNTDNQVTSIILRSNNLVGTFPSKKIFQNTEALQSLVLDGNAVEFSFEGIDLASNLETLDLTQIGLDLTVGVDSAPNLKNLYLASNNLKGTIASEIVKLTSLVRLALAFNDLTGPIPSSISNLSNLEFLSLHDNEFSGTIPTTIGTMTNLVFLLLGTNALSGAIPTQLNLLTNLGFLGLSDEHGDGGRGLSGKLPSFASLTNVKKMDLSKNQLTGSVPADFLNQTQLLNFEHVSVAENLLSGELPSALAKFPAEQYDVTDNKIKTLGDGLCIASLGGAVATFGCNAILCPPGTWNSFGRQLNIDDVCQSCPSNPFFGQSHCGDEGGKPTFSPVAQSSSSDAEILGKVYDSLKGSSWHRKDHWKQSGISVCQWFGIRCDKDGFNQVEHIILSANNMMGTMPQEIFQLPYLKTLVIDENNISIDLKTIGSARRLEVLDISATKAVNLAGIESASQLRELHMKQCGMTGTFPRQVFNLTTLEQIDFDFNSFEGPLGHEIGQLSNLRQLSGEKNSLSGVIPGEIRKLTDLVTLRLGKNSFGGNVPGESLDKLTSLTYLDLSRQTEHGGPGLSGELPRLSSLDHLTQLRLKENAFQGTVPFNFLKSVNRDEFEYADLSSNALTGTLPSAVAAIGTIYFQGNMISGVPKEFCASSRGAAFRQFGCDAFLCPPGTFNHHGHQESNETGCLDCPQAKYFGAVHCGDPTSSPTNPAPAVDELEVLKKLYIDCGGTKWYDAENWMNEDKGFCSWSGIKCIDGVQDTIESINIASNNVHGTPPTELYALPNLKSLSLYSNPLKSVSFEGIQYASKLTELLLDATGLSTVEGLGKAPSLEILNLRFNDLTGTIPSELTDLSTLHTLTMAYNGFTGSLPTGIEDMTNLEALLVSHNKISGNLREINFPSSIRRLDVSDNQLTGTIPDSFLSLVPFSAELEVDLSSNRFTGAVPTDLSRFGSLNIYLKDNMITELDKELCSMSDWNEGDVGKYGCSGILCPKGDFSPNGRHSSAGGCKQCAPGRYLHMGASTCNMSGSRKASIMSALTVSVIMVMTCL